MDTIAPNWLWAFFIISVLAALFIDFVVLKKQDRKSVV